MKTFFLTFISFYMLLSCRNSDDSFTPQNITPTLIAQGNLFSEYSNTTTTSSNLIINNDPDWNSFISNMNNPNNLSMSFNETNIDFNNFTIIAVFDQVRPTGRYKVTINSIIENNDNIIVDLNYTGNGDATQMPSHPYCVVKIPKAKKQILFQ